MDAYLKKILESIVNVCDNCRDNNYDCIGESCMFNELAKEAYQILKNEKEKKNETI